MKYIIEKPMSFSSLMDNWFDLCKRFFLRGAAYSLIGATPQIIALILLASGLVGDMSFLIMNSMGVIFAAIVFIFGQNALFRASGLACTGREVNWKEIHRVARSRWWAMLWATLTLVLAVSLGCVLLIIPGLFMMVSGCIIGPSLIMEDKGVFESWSRSWGLVKGYRWRVFGYFIVFYLVTIVISVVATAFGTLLLGPLLQNEVAATGLSQQAIGAIEFAWLPIIQTLIYYDLRIRKEAADLEVASEAIEVCPV